jgi:excisionase family DNA binding protein
MTHELLTAKEAAVHLGVKETTIWYWLTLGKLPSVKIGRARRFEKSALDAIIDIGRCVSSELP